MSYYWNIKVFNADDDIDQDKPKHTRRAVGSDTSACSAIAAVILELGDDEIADITVESVPSSDRSSVEPA